MPEDVSQPLVQASLVGEAIDRGPALVFVADEEMRHVAVNQHAADALGYTRGELLALSVADVAPTEESRSRWADLLVRSRSSGVARLRRKDGGELDFRFQARETLVAGLTLYVAVGFVEQD